MRNIIRALMVALAVMLIFLWFVTFCEVAAVWQWTGMIDVGFIERCKR